MSEEVLSATDFESSVSTKHQKMRLFCVSYVDDNEDPDIISKSICLTACGKVELQRK